VQRGPAERGRTCRGAHRARQIAVSAFTMRHVQADITGCAQ
jgi:hypothetical protein